MIDDLVEGFRQLPGGHVSHGPRHPEQPDPSTADRLDLFLADYPFLRADHDYVDFLEKYSGAYAENEDASQILDIFGFGGISTDIVEMEGPIITKDGYLIFAQCIYHIRDDGRLRETQEFDFAFDATGDRKPGVYCLFSQSETRDREFEWQHATFADWLTDLLNRGGMLEPPAVE